MIIVILILILVIGCGTFFYLKSTNKDGKKTTNNNDVVENTPTEEQAGEVNYSNGNENAKIKCNIDVNKPLNKYGERYWIENDFPSDKIREDCGVYLKINEDKRSVSAVIDFENFYTVDRHGETNRYAEYTIKGFNRDVVSVFNSGGASEIFFLLDNGEVYYSEIVEGGKINASNNIIPIGGKIEGVSGVKKFYLLAASGGTGAWYVVAGAKSDGSFYDLDAKLDDSK
jgi:hypothetical protein